MLKPLLVLVAAMPVIAAAPPVGDVSVRLQGLRNNKGSVLVCLSADPQHFLKCQSTLGSVGRKLAPAQAASVSLGRVPAGRYALLVVHDENGNGKLDMMLGIPREGFGFSNNPAMRPRAPRWDEISFDVKPGPVTQTVRVRYVL